MNTVLQQELVRFNNLLSGIRPCLFSLLQAVKGTIVMTEQLEEVATDMFYGKIPRLWMTKSYPSLKSLNGYVADLVERLTMFDNWLQLLPPKVYWLSGFYFPQAFLTGTLQNFARQRALPIDNIGFCFSVEKALTLQVQEYPHINRVNIAESRSDLDLSLTPPTSGTYCYGLYLDGARFDLQSMKLADSKPKELFSRCPVLWFKPIQKDQAETEAGTDSSLYSCPVYKTSERRGVLATTGHSSNFVMTIQLPSDAPQQFWIERGVALLAALDD